MSGITVSAGSGSGEGPSDCGRPSACCALTWQRETEEGGERQRKREGETERGGERQKKEERQKTERQGGERVPWRRSCKCTDSLVPEPHP